MEILKIAFGGTSEQKIGYLKEVLEELNIKAEIIPVKVESGITEQPMTSEETKTGSLNRAINALEKSGIFKEVHSPVSNLLKEVDVDFSLILDLN